jgi:hypothetical protein
VTSLGADLPLDDVLGEARRVIAAADSAGLTVRLLGGAAFGLHQHDPVPAELQRTYGDLDVAIRGRDARHLPKVLTGLGYVGDERFNALHGEKRMLFRDPTHDRKFDVFVGEFSMCHKLKLEDRLPPGEVTLAVTDLLLMKLQIVEINTKDLIDCLVLLHDHDATSGGAVDPDVVDLDRIAAICAADWGWHTTVGDNLTRLTDAARERLAPDMADRVVTRLGEIRSAIDDRPKSRAWRLRARLGRRVEWYETPEEVG